MPDTSPLLLIPLVSAAIQQLLELVSPIYDLIPISSKNVVDPTWKKFFFGCLSFLIGWACAAHLFPKGLNGTAAPSHFEQMVIGLLLGSGTEGANSLLKYVQGAKDSLRQKTQQDVTIIPAAAQIASGATITLVTPHSDSVVWSILESDGGSVEPKTGTYTAPPNKKGTFHVLARSQQDPSSYGISTITVI